MEAEDEPPEEGGRDESTRPLTLQERLFVRQARDAIRQVRVMRPEITLAQQLLRDSASAQAFRQRSASVARSASSITEKIRAVAALAQPRWQADLRDMVGLFQRQQERYGDFAKQAADALLRIYPANVRGVTGLTIDKLRQVVLDDGIALRGVPRMEIAQALLDAPRTARRREILGSRWKAILQDCEAHLAEGTDPEFDALRGYVAEAIAALREGHTSPAQALAANLLDTIVQAHFTADMKILKPNRKGTNSPNDYEAFAVRKFWAVAPIWSAYQQFIINNGDSIPRNFSRHASAHAVSRTQFSRRNAVQCIMLVTSLLGYLDEERTGRRP